MSRQNGDGGLVKVPRQVDAVRNVEDQGFSGNGGTRSQDAKVIQGVDKDVSAAPCTTRLLINGTQVNGGAQQVNDTICTRTTSFCVDGDVGQIQIAVAVGNLNIACARAVSPQRPSVIQVSIYVNDTRGPTTAQSRNGISRVDGVRHIVKGLGAPAASRTGFNHRAGVPNNQGIAGKVKGLGGVIEG